MKKRILFLKANYADIILFTAIVLNIFTVASSLSEGDDCMTQSGLAGECLRESRCKNVFQLIQNKETAVRCELIVFEEVICCPKLNTPEIHVTESPVSTRANDRASVKACKIIESNLIPGLTTHIIDGKPVSLGEYPHMAALGYPIIGNEEYDFRCGGTLIDGRFVLTAAHCVVGRDSQPTLVRLGLVNMKDDEQLREAVNVPIEKIHIHPTYTNSRAYHDIAIVELERNVTNLPYVYPTCLYTEPEDPPADSIMYVTGWGVINTGTRAVSNILLKARLFVSPLKQCNESYVTGKNRQLPHGLDSTQLCAYDPGGSKDACQGDSGGPLNLVIDESTQMYKVVGIISTGFSCGSLTPGLYTRVSSYLDFIESIVWPHSDPF